MRETSDSLSIITDHDFIIANFCLYKLPLLLQVFDYCVGGRLGHIQSLAINYLWVDISNAPPTSCHIWGRVYNIFKRYYWWSIYFWKVYKRWSSYFESSTSWTVLRAATFRSSTSWTVLRVYTPQLCWFCLMLWLLGEGVLTPYHHLFL